MLRSFTSSETKESPLKDKYVTPIVETHTIQSQKNLPPYYIGHAQVLPPVGWGALDGGE